MLLRRQAACVQKDFRCLLPLPQRKAVVVCRLRRVHGLPPQRAAGLPLPALLLPQVGSEVCPLLGKFPLQLRHTRVAGQAAARLGVGAQPLYLAVVKGKGSQALSLVQEAVEKGEKPGEIIDTYLIPAINYVGELFEKGTYFLPQLIASAEAMEKAIDYLEPFLAKERGDEKLETIVVATVKGDIHDIGKNLVVLMLKNYGYDVIDLGKDVDSQLIIDTAVKENASIIGLSALMTTTMTAMKEVVELAKEQGVKAKIIIGGAVVTESYAKEIGADGYSKDAREAVKLVNRLLEK